MILNQYKIQKTLKTETYINKKKIQIHSKASTKPQKIAHLIQTSARKYIPIQNTATQPSILQLKHSTKFRHPFTNPSHCLTQSLPAAHTHATIHVSPDQAPYYVMKHYLKISSTQVMEAVKPMWAASTWTTRCRLLNNMRSMQIPLTDTGIIRYIMHLRVSTQTKLTYLKHLIAVLKRLELPTRQAQMFSKVLIRKGVSIPQHQAAPISKQAQHIRGFRDDTSRAFRMPPSPLRWCYASRAPALVAYVGGLQRT